VTTLAVMRRFDLTDEQWARLESLLPVPVRSGRPPLWTKRQLIDGIRWRVRVGAPWRDVPECYGSWRAVYSLFRRWQRAGVWAAIVTGLQTRADASGRIIWEISVDSMITRAHQHAAGARSTPQKESAGGVTPEPADHALGRSRGGFTTKIHLACEQGQNVMSLLLTAGQRGDSPQFQNVLDKINVPRMGAGRPRTRPERVRADKAYSSRANRAYLADAASPRPSPSPPTRSATARTAAEPEGVHPGSAPRTTELVTPSNAASTGSNATVEWPPGMTSSPSATRPASTSPSSTTGC